MILEMEALFLNSLATPGVTRIVLVFSDAM